MLLSPVRANTVTDLEGNRIKDHHYYARKLIARAAMLQIPMCKLLFLPDYIDNRMHTKILHDGKEIVLGEQGGFYVVYHKDPLLEYEAYAGFSINNIRQRFSRYGYEICEIPTNHGGHSGAAKHRVAGGTRHNIYVRYLTSDQIDFDIPENIYPKLDEAVASAVGARYNTKIII